VIERARSIEAARCPLCRAPFVPTKGVQQQQQQHRNPSREVERPQQRNQTTATAIIDPLRDTEVDTVRDEGSVTRRLDETASTANINGVNATDGDRDRPMSPMNVNAEDSIFRFTTEGLLPDWIPLPGFSFEIVRRPSPTNVASTNTNTTTDGTNVVETGTVQLPDQPPPSTANERAPNPVPPAAEQSVFRRIMLLAGLVHMTPEEEAVALEQLMDMFPQYDRQDLQRALRQRGTIDAVVESILIGVFVGIPHGGG
jgi:hypothetical protein